MFALQLSNLVAVQPHGTRLRKRVDRLLTPIRPSNADQMWYRAELYAIVGLLRRAGMEFLATVKRQFPHTGGRDSAMQAVPSKDALPMPVSIKEEIDRMGSKFGGIDMVARRLGKMAAARAAGNVDDKLAAAITSSVKVDVSAVFKANPLGRQMEAAAKANADLIVTVPARYIEGVRDVMSQAWARGDRWETVVEDVANVGDVAEWNARRIARDQMSKMNADFNEARQTSVGIKRYVWHGALDSRERKSHRDMEGTVQRWDSPPSVDGEDVHPGQAILCRCFSSPLIDLDETDESEAA